MKNTNKLKGKLMITGLAVSLCLSGCSFNLNEKSGEIESINPIEYEDSTMASNSKIDDIMGFEDKTSDDSSLDYTYLIDNSGTTKATFAHVVDEKTITSNGKFFDGKEEVNCDVFSEDIIQPITLPIAFTLFNIEDMGVLSNSYGDCDITGKKMITLDGDVLYYFEGIFTFNSFADKYIDLGINEGDTMIGKALYRVSNSGSLELLYKSQTGYKEDSPNVLEENYNNYNKIVIPLEDTVFSDMNGEYSENYLREALDVYSGTDMFYNAENEGLDFSKYKKY